MSTPAGLGIAVVAVLLGAPVIAAGTAIEAHHRVAGAADAAALAAADAAAGWIDAKPCRLADEVAGAMSVKVVRCQRTDTDVRVETRAVGALGAVRGRARAGFIEPASSGATGPPGAVGANGWAWPSDRPGVTQGFHDGYAIDLAVSDEGALFAAFDGVVVFSGRVDGGIPGVCLTNPSWWRGPNHAVIIKHVYEGQAIFSSHNHISAGSGVATGTQVRAGQRVATAGMTGCTSGLHTHFTMSTRPQIDAPDLNPYDFLDP